MWIKLWGRVEHCNVSNCRLNNFCYNEEYPERSQLETILAQAGDDDEDEDGSHIGVDQNVCKGKTVLGLIIARAKARGPVWSPAGSLSPTRWSHYQPGKQKICQIVWLPGDDATDSLITLNHLCPVFVSCYVRRRQKLTSFPRGGR